MTDFSRYRECIPYARYSSRAQARGTSEQRQAEAFNAFAAAHGITLSDRRAIDRGLSGFHGTNLSDGALGTLVEDLHRGVIPTPALLLLERQDRFGRQASTQALVTLFSDLLGRGCDIYHLHQQRLYSIDLLNQDFGALVTLAAEVHAAHHYSATLSQRSRAAHAIARDGIRAGKALRPGWSPRWIDRTDTGWRLNDYAPTVLRLVELLESGLGQIAVAKQLNAEGLQAPRGGRWTAGGVGHVMNSPAIAGGREVKRRSGEVVWSYWPEVISRPRREALLAMVAARATGHAAPGQQDQCRWIGQCLSSCTCGRAAGFRSASYRQADGTRVVRTYVRCRGRMDRSCDQPAMVLELAHAHLLTRLQPQQLASLLSASDDGQVSAARARVERIRRERDQAAAMAAAAEREITAALADAEAGAARVLARSVAAAEQQVQQLQAELEAAEHDLAAAMTGPGLEELREPVGQLLRSFARGEDTPDQRRAVNRLLRRMGMRIVVDGMGMQMGLAIGSGAIDWQPVSELQGRFLEDGRAGIRSEAIDGTALAIVDGDAVTLQFEADFLRE